MDPVLAYRLALQSPALVGAKDRDGWVGLFHPQGFVEDPVEAGRYQGTANIQKFWDVFIGPQPSIAFDVTRDFWTGDTLIRQATVVNVTQAHPERTLDVPALIRYTLREGKLGSLQAVWEPRHVVSWFFGMGARGLGALTRHGLRMTSQAGLRNVMSFAGTLAGGLSRAAAEALVDAIRSGDASRWDVLRSAEITVGDEDECRRHDGEPRRALDFLAARAESLPKLEVDRLVVCGHHVGAFLREPRGSGALALMLRTQGPSDVASITAVWSSEPRVLALP